MNDRLDFELGHLRTIHEKVEAKNDILLHRAIYGDCFFTFNEDGGVKILDPETVVVEPPAAPPKEEKSALDDAKDAAEPKDANGGSKPPEDGTCRECKRLRRLNRLRLCYPCYVELNIADGMKKRGQEWKPGDKHPAWCDCEGLGEHPERDNGAWRGN
jgi:hypothetical protein